MNFVCLQPSKLSIHRALRQRIEFKCLKRGLMVPFSPANGTQIPIFAERLLFFHSAATATTASGASVPPQFDPLANRRHRRIDPSVPVKVNKKPLREIQSFP
jgi:hypothetical protein